MFNESQVEFMRKIGLKLDFNNLSDEALVKIEEVIGDEYTLELMNHPEGTTKKAQMCESILDQLSE